MMPNAIPRAATLENRSKNRNLVEERLANHSVGVCVAGDDATGFIDDGDDVRPLAAPAGWILEPFGDILGRVERASPTLVFTGRSERVLHGIARRAIRDALG